MKTGKYTWQIVNNGTVTVGLGRMPADTIEEAVEVAKNLEKLGYVFEGVVS